MVLKKSKTEVAGGDEMRYAEIHMNRRLQVFFSGSCIEDANVTCIISMRKPDMVELTAAEVRH